MHESQRLSSVYRRAMEIKHKCDLLRIISYSGYKPHIGYIDWARVDGVWQVHQVSEKLQCAAVLETPL